MIPVNSLDEVIALLHSAEPPDSLMGSASPDAATPPRIDAIGATLPGFWNSAEAPMKGYFMPGMPEDASLRPGYASPLVARSSSTPAAAADSLHQSILGHAEAGGGARWSKLVGILFCMPNTKLAREEVVPHLAYFHRRSKTHVDVFCPGYTGSRIARDLNLTPTITAAVVTVGAMTWNFDATTYDTVRAQLERRSTWKYSGETDLILVEARRNDADRVYLDFTCSIACNLEEMLRDQAISSVRAFFEQLFRYGEQARGASDVWGLSDRFGLRTAGAVLQDAVLGLLPEAARKLYKSGKHFVIRDISRSA